jgi:hypothetical protein
MQNNKNITRCGSTKLTPFYSIPKPKEGERITFLDPMKLKVNPCYELNGQVTKKNYRAKFGLDQEDYKYSKKTLLKSRETDIFNTKAKSYNYNIAPSTVNYTNTRISHMIYKEPQKKYKEKNSNTFRSFGVSFDYDYSNQQTDRPKSELKRCELSKHSHTSQILTLPGATHRKEDDINDDHKINKSFDLKRSYSTARTLSKDQFSTIFNKKSNLKNVQSEVFFTKYNDFLIEKYKVTNNTSKPIGKGNYLNSEIVNNNKKINFKKDFLSNSIFSKQGKSDLNKENKTKANKLIKNVMLKESKYTPKNVVDSIYYPLQIRSHKKQDIVKNNLNFRSEKNLIK